MNTLIVPLIVIICMGEVYSRHLLDEGNDPDSLSSDQNDGVRKHSSEVNRHRRRRWQANYGTYDYALPASHYYPERRDYDRNQQDLLPQIIKLLEEISAYVKRPQLPPPPPQPIYIPYPVVYPIPQFSSCSENSENTGKKPSIHNRFPVMEDSNQNWGFVIDKDDETDDFSNGRPISFDPIKPIRPMKRPAPKVEHGSTMDQGQQPSTAAPQFTAAPGALRTPSMCNAAILSCCADGKSQREECFNNFGCGVSYNDENACSVASINNALESFRVAYSPVH